MQELAQIGRWLAKAHAYPFYVLRSTFKAVFDFPEDDRFLLTRPDRVSHYESAAPIAT